MKRAIKTITLLLLLSAVTFSVEAQKTYKNQITVNPRELSQKKDSLIINMDIDFSGLVMDDDRSLSLIPMLVSKEKQTELPSVLINGRRRHKLYKRTQILNKGKKEKGEAVVFEVIKAEKNAKKRINYSLSIPFENWMKDARLDLKEDLCGCAGHKQQIAIDKMIATVLMEGESRYDVKPLLSFIRPEVEEIKRRSEQRDVFLDFPVAKTEIIPGYMNNPGELNKIETMLQEIRVDKDLEVNDINIKGYASPEGSASFNNKLSRARAESLRLHLASRSASFAKVYHVENGGEDWEGLEKLVSESYLDYKNEILTVITSSKPEDIREQELKRIKGGIVYSELLKDFFPQLRRVLCRVDYTVRGFNVEEAKEVISQRPQLLSLEELFLVANTYSMDEKEFSDVFETAVRLYPDDKIANFNAAASALQWGDTERAKKYLDKSPVDTKEYANNMGVYYLLTGELMKARNLFNYAADSGVATAIHNLKELERKIEVEDISLTN